ncbi:MAG: NmrA/HSCARG family protein [bacterium]
MAKKLNILVAGATGQQGGSVARALLDNGHHVRALTRRIGSPAAQALKELGAELHEGDLSKKETLPSAFEGVDAVFGVTTPFEAGMEAETQQGVNLVDAAKEAGIGHFVFSSVGKADKATGIPHFDSKYEVEKHLKASGVPYTIIAPVFFTENWLSPWFLPSIQEGNVALAMPGDRSLAHISVDDIGRFAALIFERRGEFLGKRFDIAGDDVSGVEVARRLSARTGKKLGYFEIPLEGMREQNEDFALMFEWFNKVGYNVDVAKLKRDYPEVHWTSFDDWAARQDWSVLDASAG